MKSKRLEWNEYQRKWRATHKQQSTEISKRYRQRHPEYVARTRENRIARIKKLKAEIYKLLGGKCVRCGFSDSRALQIDHVIATGAKGRKEWAKGREIYSKILEEITSGNPHNYQLLCANCNWIKRWENHEGGC